MKYLLIYILLLVAGCDGESTMTEKVSLPLISDIPESTWKKLSQKTIYFGHQSVGNNIIDGVNKIMENNDVIKLNIKNTNDVQTSDVPVFAHSDIGKNDDIDSKLNDFSKNIRKGFGDKADIAFLKLCFWDVRRKTDVNKVFNDYKKTMTSLKKEYPNTKFVHLTVPLMSRSNGFVAKIKRMIKPDNDDLDNIKRNELNTLIINEYGNKEPVFDVFPVCLFLMTVLVFTVFACFAFLITVSSPDAGRAPALEPAAFCFRYTVLSSSGFFIC